MAEKDRPLDYSPQPTLISAGLGLPRVDPLAGPRDTSVLSESRSFTSVPEADRTSLEESELSFTTKVAQSGGISETLSSTRESVWAL